MRLRNIPSARQELAESRYVINETALFSLRGKWADVFNQMNRKEEESCDGSTGQTENRPIRIEIGMGKGRFLLEMARRNPDVNYIGIERYSSVLVHPVRRLGEMEQAGTPLSNLLLLRMDAEHLPEVFAPGEIDRIYLNFSDPWPKDRHAKRRLPGRVFLGRYEQVLGDGGIVEFKTDNRGLFDFALEEAQAAGWNVEECTFDLHSDPVMNKDNIMTEYEAKFSELGNPICKLIECAPRDRR